MSAPPDLAPPSLIRSAALGLCPRCGARGLFAGLAQFAPKCESCGLDFARFNVGDGPAAFLILIVGTVACVIAGWLAPGSADPVPGEAGDGALGGDGRRSMPRNRQIAPTTKAR